MAVTNPSFWERLGRSGLFVPAAANSLRTQFQLAADNGSSTPRDVVAWLKKSGLISDYQSRLLLGGFEGSFSFGEYTLVDRAAGVLGLPTFAGRHAPTRHDVQMVFVPGSEPRDGDLWEAVASRARLLRKCQQPSLLRVHESVELNEYRFVVIDKSAGTPLSDRLGTKGRIPWSAACGLAIHLAQAIEEIHQLGIAHGNLNPREVCLESNGFPRLSPPIWPVRVAQDAQGTLGHYIRPQAGDAATTPVDDLYALATLLFRLIRGETPLEYLSSQSLPSDNLAPALAKLAKYELPDGLTSLLDRALHPEKSTGMKSIGEFVQGLRALTKTGVEKIGPLPSSATGIEYAEWLRRWRVPEPEPGKVISAQSTTPEAELGTIAAANFDQLPTDRGGIGVRRRKKKSFRVAAIVWGMTAVGLIIALFGISRWLESPNPGRGTAQTPATGLPAVVENSVTPENPTAAQPTPVAAGATSNWIQKIVEDNGETLWESPTNGPAIDFSHLAPGASVLLVIRPSELARQAESPKLAAAFGQPFQEYISWLSKTLAVSLESIDQLVMGFHPTETQKYEPFFRVRLVEPRKRDELLAAWTANGFAVDAANPAIWSAGEMCFGIPGSADVPASDPPTVAVEGFVNEYVCGSRENVESALLVEAANPLTGPLAQLVTRTDSQRHLTILGLKAGLFNEQGQQLLPPPFRSLQRPIARLIEDQVRGILFSVHFDQGTYAELVFDETADIRADELHAAVAAKWKTARDQLTAYVASLPAEPHWEKVHQRYDDMLTDVSQHLRIGVEYDQVLLNVWLPEMAAHNLIGASELALSSSPTAVVAATETPAGPADIQQLLQIRRTLQNDNPPDLNILIDTLQNEIRDDYPRLPFAFEIRLSNTDLREAGITRNQRLSALALVDQTLEQVLTQICFLANPDKNATGPTDPRCSLIWVLTRDPETNVDLILLTTRAAAEKNNWPIPAVFTATPQ